MLLNNIMGKKLLGMFKRGIVSPFRMWTQKPTHQNLALPWKTVVQRSKYFTNSWTGLLESLPLLSTSFFLLKAPIYYLTIHGLYKLIPDYDLQRASCTIPQKDFWFLMLRGANEERCLGLSSAKRVPASVVFWTLSSQLPQASAWASRLLHSVAGTKDLKEWQKCLIQGPLPKTKHEWSGERRGDRNGWVRKGAQEADPKLKDNIKKGKYYVCIYKLKAEHINA